MESCEPTPHSSPLPAFFRVRNVVLALEHLRDPRRQTVLKVLLELVDLHDVAELVELHGGREEAGEQPVLHFYVQRDVRVGAEPATNCGDELKEFGVHTIN